MLAEKVIASRRWAWLVALVPLLVAGVLMGTLGEAERDPGPTDSLPRGLDSTLGVELREELPDADASTAVVVFETADGESGIADQQRALEQTAADLGAVPVGAGGEQGGGQGGPPSRLLVAEDGTAALAVVPVDGGTATEVADQVTELRDTVDDAVPSGIEASVTGPAAVQADLAEVFSGADLRLLGATATVVALLLVITYRSPVLWIVPLLVVGVADRFAAVAATQTLAALDLAWDESTVGILSVLVFGAGTDYALLLISRYRDELARTPSRHAAMARALRRTAEAVLSSSVTVVVGVLTLALSLTPTTRGLGVACAVGIVIAAFFALVALPAALVLFGRWVFWPRVPHVDSAPEQEQDGTTSAADARLERTLWHRLGVRVAGRPALFVIGTTVVLLALASNVLRIDTGLDIEDQFLDEPEAITAAARIDDSFPAGTASPTQVVARATTDEVIGAVQGVDGVASARPSAEGSGVSEVSLVLDAAPGTDQAADAIENVRDAVADLDDAHVTGQEAEAIDEAEAAARDRLVIFPLILLLVLLALGGLLRSVVAPILLVATVVATYAASLGASWWIFTSVFDFGALDSGAPLLSFLFLVALGVDYNIFLLTRAGEELRDHDPRTAMLRALSATGGVITSAGVLLAAVFLVLGVLPLVVLAQLGVIVCIGVLLDTLVVRTVLVPALAFVLGERFWWPRRVVRDAS
ncbi:MMPL family transporter [Nocardioides sambongensis]|uniref:MMPL family transporter n=1 Tax=Nocardioides sambongensis TaxID=2589074 RepID=UPI0011282F98|nr:MMPL family transporter [Nocardioides sambongensis]